MDKNAIKKYATWARVELISRVAQKAQQYGITEEEMVDANADSVNGRVLSAEEMQQRKALIARIEEKGYQQVMEEVAYTWFNRFSALRFMEVNGYLPSRVRVFTNENNEFKPQILSEVFDLTLEGLDTDKVYRLKQEEKTEELYKYLLIVQCNALNRVLPGMFQTIADYTELLLPDNLLREGSVIEQMITLIPENNWKDAVQIIGWLYQYYNSEKKDEVFAALKKNVKITKENIPAATQLFTPDWIVRYMVENSLGRMWVEGHPDTRAQLLPTPEEQAAYIAGVRDEEDPKWHYYLEEAPQEPEVEQQLAAIRKQYAALTPEQIKVIDPCCGSGHILAYLFDVLMRIYESYGYTARDAVTSILQNNLYGLDIDDRAAQLAYFAVMMKAVRYDKRFLKRKDENGEPDIPQPHVYAIQESNYLEKADVEVFCNGKSALQDAMRTILNQLYDAKEYGSIITVTPQDWDALYARSDEVADESSFHRESILKKLLPLVQVAQALAQKYDVVVTNPPYMGNSGMGAKLAEYVKENYPDSKSDLFAVFIEVCARMAKTNAYQAMITQHAWMFLSSFEKLREKMMHTETVSMAHLGARAFEEIGGEVVQTTAFVRCANHMDGYKGTYCRLIEPTTQQGKEEMFLAGQNRYNANQDDFAKIPGSPVAYWVSDNFLKAFDNEKIGKYAISDGQTKTGDNDKYLRLLWEIPTAEIGKGKHWVLHAKGGAFRRWYGNIDTLIDWSDLAREHYRKDHVARIAPEYIWFRKGICWTLISSNKLHGFRLLDDNSTFNLAAPSIFFDDEEMMFYVLGYLNSKFSQEIIALLNPTLNTNIGDITSQPLCYKKDSGKENVVELVKSNIDLSKKDWDSFETSWDFTRHPFIKAITKYPHQMDIGNIYLAECYDIWAAECEERFAQLKANEEELNRIFIDIYGLQDELTPEVEEKDVTVRRADLGRDVRSFISYAVGCMFGRYSPTYDGLAYAGGEFSDQWVVVSGQYYKREDVEWYVSEELQRTLGMAEVDADRGGNVPAGEAAAEGRIVCFVGSDAKSRSIPSFQYRRGTSKELYKGIRKLSLDRAGFGGGTGNAVYDLCSPEILAAITNGTGDELVERGWKDAQRVDWQAIHSALTTDHLFTPDKDGIIPICDDEYFEDDIVGRFVEFVRVVYGDNSLEDNLLFIAKALGGKGQPKEVIRNYFLNDFYADHCKIYQKRPIYWLFDSGKKNGFKCLIYMHRYQPDTIARIRTDYVHEQQARYDTVEKELEQRAAKASGSERVKLNNQWKKIHAQAQEIHEYEEKIHSLADQMIKIDLDDGVKHNYAIFEKVLAKIK